ncbi:MAG TPA: hypothetical protein VF148_03775 [Acidimicrobiia bacterium]
MCFRAKPYHVGFRVDDQETGPDPKAQGKTASVDYWYLDGVKRIQEQPFGVSAEIQSPIADVRGGTSIATLTDPDENPVGLLEDTA